MSKGVEAMLRLAALLLILVANAASAKNSVLLIQPVAYARLIDHNLDNGFDTIFPGVSVGFTLHPLEMFETRSALEYSLSSIPPGSFIQSAVFTIRPASFFNTLMGVDGVKFYGYAGDGMITESDAHNTANLIATSGPAKLPGPVVIPIDVTSFIRDSYQQGVLYPSLLLAAVRGDGEIGQRFGEEYLTVTFVPEPGTAVLLACAFPISFRRLTRRTDMASGCNAKSVAE
jgi:hypothetical protein